MNMFHRFGIIIFFAFLFGYMLNTPETIIVEQEPQFLEVGAPVHKPTLEEVEEFLRYDKTDLKNYINGSYMCLDFSLDVARNASYFGIEAFPSIIIRNTTSAHAVVCFDTVEKGVIYFEPQTDAYYDPFNVGGVAVKKVFSLPISSHNPTVIK